MKISIKNFGPIDHFEFDLEKDLHVIYGENNIGKSWAINSIYLLLKSWKEVTDKWGDGKKDSAFPTFEFDLMEFLEKFNNKIETTFVESKNKISGLQPNIDINIENFQINLMNEVNRFYELENKNQKNINELPNLSFDNIYFLPASKSGIYQVLSNMGNIFAQLSQIQLKNKSLNLPSMSIPISDYILNISTINSSKQSKFGNSVNFLEEKVIEGSVIFDDFQKKLKYKSNRTGLVSELHEASSMIAEISPLVAYLKYIVPQSNSILFIEEPEAHLHPKIQVEIMKVFVQLVKAGVKVVMTTHSDFMMDTLTNQILAQEIEADNIASYHLVMGENGSYDAGDMKATVDGTQDHNFISVSEQLYNERMELYEKLNETDAVEEN